MRPIPYAGATFASIVAACAASVASGAVAAAQTAAPIVVPVAAGAPWTPARIAALDADIDALLANAPTLRGAHVGVLASETAGGAELYRRAADDEFQPASTLKLLVGSVALDALAPEFRFRTTIRVVPRTGLDAVVAVMGGDPFLTTDDLASAARAVATSSVDPAFRTRPKSVVVDATHFDERPYPEGWTWDDFGQAYAPRVSAAALEEGLVHLVVTPGDAPNAPAVVRSRSVADVREPAGRCDGAPGRPVVVPRATTGSAGSPDTLDVALGPDGCMRVVGSIPLGAEPESVDAAVPDPVTYAREAMRATLADAGLGLAATDAPAASVAGDAGTVAWTHDSPPLRAFLGPRFWIPSDNLVGEVLLKELGVAAGGAPGTTAAGVAYERRWLRGIGIDPATVTLADGCGMSQYDRITPRDLVAILQHDWNGPERRLVLDALPVGGARGTIEGLAGTPAAGRTFAKTGSMMHVRGLAGYLATLHHGAVTFAFAVDDWNGAYADLAALRARVLARIVTD